MFSVIHHFCHSARIWPHYMIHVVILIRRMQDKYDGSFYPICHSLFLTTCLEMNSSTAYSCTLTKIKLNEPGNSTFMGLHRKCLVKPAKHKSLPDQSAHHAKCTGGLKKLKSIRNIHGISNFFLSECTISTIHPPLGDHNRSSKSPQK